jgi:redox-sensing transcriptional repressor
MLVGAGNLGSAILAYQGFKEYGLEIVAAFDNDRKKIGKKICNITVKDVANLGKLKKQEIDLAIMTVPAEAAQGTVDVLVEAGIKGILNFSPFYLKVPRKIKVINIDVAMDLARLPYYIPANRKSKKK